MCGKLNFINDGEIVQIVINEDTKFMMTTEEFEELSNKLLGRENQDAIEEGKE